MLVVGIDRKTSAEAIRLATAHNFIYAAIGIHPHNAYDLSGQELNWFKKQLSHDKVVAIGEVGLDYYYKNSTREAQLQMLNSFVELAAQTNYPLIFHVRPAADNISQPIFDDMFQVMDKYGGKKLRGVFHCFAGSSERMQQVLEYNFFFSAAGNITFPRSQRIKRVFEKIPLDRILLETDSPYLAPHGKRGDKNTPLNIDLVYEKTARLKNVSPELMSDMVFINSGNLFGW